jgi:hypothetical protein
VRACAALLVLAAVLAAGCGGGKRPDRNRTFTDPGFPFTFRYPKAFHASTRDQGSTLALVALDARNALAIRRTSVRALDPDQYLSSLRAAFTRQGLRVTARRERHAGQAMGVLEFVIPASNPAAGGRADLHTESYFFTGGGATWQLECRSTARRAQVEGACATALASLHFRRH